MNAAGKYPSTLRQARQKLGLTQSELANRASLSLATVQNLESGKGNPALATLEALISVLGLEIHLTQRKLNWDLLISHGLPIMSEGDLNVRPERATLLSSLSDIAANLDQVDLKSRESEALQGLLVALRDHYPSLWNRLPESLLNLKISSSSRLIKLRRMALQKLAYYL